MVDDIVDETIENVLRNGGRTVVVPDATLAQHDRIAAVLPPEQSLPAPGQGALGLECRADRADLIALLGALDHAPTAACVRAERALSRALGGSCQLPLGAYAQNEGEAIRQIGRAHV